MGCAMSSMGITSLMKVILPRVRASGAQGHPLTVGHSRAARMRISHLELAVLGLLVFHAGSCSSACL